MRVKVEAGHGQGGRARRAKGEEGQGQGVPRARERPKARKTKGEELKDKPIINLIISNLLKHDILYFSLMMILFVFSKRNEPLNMLHNLALAYFVETFS